MEVRYTLTLHPDVIAWDVPRLDTYWREVIRDAMRERLRTQPELYGKSLRDELKGYRKLRVGDYRVIFRIQASRVLVLGILHRSVAYQQALKRL